MESNRLICGRGFIASNNFHVLFKALQRTSVQKFVADYIEINDKEPNWKIKGEKRKMSDSSGNEEAGISAKRQNLFYFSSYIISFIIPLYI